MRQNHLGQWAIAFAVMVVTVFIAYQFLDRPIAFYSAAHFAKKPWFDGLTQIPEYLSRIAVGVFVIAGIFALIGRPLPHCLAVALASSVSLVAASSIKDAIKFAFGRTWPETWVQNNPSLIRDGTYGFNFFHGGQGYASFPSGHTTATCAVMAVLWFCCPRLRALYALVIAAVVIGLIGADYHFLSDIIAGGFLGWLAGWVTLQVWHVGERVTGRPDTLAKPEQPGDAPQ
jgi:membrane-associated phospholipid phosphatase